MNIRFNMKHSHAIGNSTSIVENKFTMLRKRGFLYICPHALTSHTVIFPIDCT
uniref:Uncharacterized protein n=1 Tax=Rhizophora mucronata TaxID=61149 RepID=A0A2P2ITG0_RHIMU